MDYYDRQELEQFFDKLEKLIVFSPFADGLSQLADVKVPMNLYGETQGSYHTLMGLQKGKRFLPWSFKEEVFFADLLEGLPKVAREIKVIKGENPSIKRSVHLYASNWITDRSENLKKLYEKNPIWTEIPLS